MRNDPTNTDPSPEQLAAFLDGELDPAARPQVEAWLSANPDAAAEIDGQRRLARLWADNRPPEPAPAAWDATLGRIEARLPRPTAHRPRRLLWPLWLGAGAAAVVAAVLLTRPFWPGQPPKAPKVDPIAVVAPDGPPAEPPILLAGQDDVSVMSMEPSAQDDGMVPLIGEGDVPMIVAPSLARAGTP